jgi:hypothetical protein
MKTKTHIIKKRLSKKKKDKAILNEMMEKNPSIKTLVDKLNLKHIKTKEYEHTENI